MRLLNWFLPMLAAIGLAFALLGMGNSFGEGTKNPAPVRPRDGEVVEFDDDISSDMARRQMSSIRR
jgi:hypothetical protein